jgi:glycosyltransferase XagB
VAEPPDLTLVNRFGAAHCLRSGLLPWRRLGGAVVILSARPGQLARHAERLAACFGQVRMAHATEARLRAALFSVAAPALIDAAENCLPPLESSRTLGLGGVPALVGFGLALFAAMILFPRALLVILTLWAVVCFIGGLWLKLASLLVTTFATQTAKRPGPPGRLPVISILVPLYRESEIADHLMRRMAMLDYPRELPDLCIILEDDDAQTRRALAFAPLPH